VSYPASHSYGSPLMSHQKTRDGFDGSPGIVFPSLIFALRSLIRPRLTPPYYAFTFRSIAVETIGEAVQRSWRVTARCARRKQDGMHRHRECVYRCEHAGVDPRRRLPAIAPGQPSECPTCGSRQVVVPFQPLANRQRAAAG
jgi:hypothetical protein